MAKEIKWTKTAAKNFAKTISYLEENWPEPVVSEFIRRTYELLLLLSEFPKLGELQDSNRGIRGILISKHNKLFYRIEKNNLIVLKVFDTAKIRSNFVSGETEPILKETDKLRKCLLKKLQ